MDKEKLAKSIIEKILGNKDTNKKIYINAGIKRNNEDEDENDDTNKKNKTNTTKFSELPPGVEKLILSFLDVDKDKKDILKYGMINKTKYNNFNYNTNNSYGKTLMESIIYDAKDVSRYIINNKFTIDTENIQNLTYDSTYLNFDIFIKILKKKRNDKKQLNSLKVNSNKSIVYPENNIDITPMFQYITELETLNLYLCNIKTNVFNFNKLKNISFERCHFEDISELKKLKNIESFVYNNTTPYEFDSIELLKEISNNNTLKTFICSDYTLNKGGFQYLQNVTELQCNYEINLIINGDLKYLEKLEKLEILFDGLISTTNPIEEYKLFPKYFKNLKHLLFNFTNNEDEFTTFTVTKTIGKYENLISYKQYHGTNDPIHFSGLKNLKTLNLYNVEFIDRDDFRDIADFDPTKIKDLTITHEDIDRRTDFLFLAFTNLDRLKTSLDLYNSDLIPILPSIKYLIILKKQIHIDDDIFKYMTKIQTLQIDYAKKFTNNGFIYLLQNSKYLYSLDLKKNDDITDKIFMYIDNLEHLYLDDFSQIYLHKIIENFKNLKIDIMIDQKKLTF
jgi:hypothetical protein